MARVPEEVLAEHRPAADPDPGPTRPRFWAAPAAAPPPAQAALAEAPPGDAAPAGAAPRGVPVAIDVLGAVGLPGGAILVVPGEPGPADRAAIVAAAEPLLAVLADRGLLTFDDGSPS